MFAVSASSRRLRALRFLFAIALFGAASPAAFATNYAVGIGCTYSTIQAAVNAAQAQLSGSRPIVYIVGNQQYDSQAITTSAHSISFVGGIPDCTHFTPSGKTTINGKGNASVFTVTGTTAGQAVGFSHLSISKGGGSSGGGISLSGAGTMTVDNTTIDSNKATEGGGIRFVASGGGATLAINTETIITNNTATNSGGGIRVDGSATVNINADRTWIAFNTATNGSGGGLIVVSPATANIGSPGYPFGDYLPVIYENTAQYGGGIAVVAASDACCGSANLVASGKALPVRVEQNRAYHTGGGVYLQPYQSVGGSAFAVLKMGGAHIDGNVAAEGSGIYSDTDSSLGEVYGGTITMLSGNCNAGLECNTVSDNLAEDASNAPTTGSAILLQTQTYFKTAQLAMRRNQGAHVIRVADGLDGVGTLDTCLLADNVVSGELVTFGSASASVTQCTFANNTIGGTSVFYAETGFTMTNSIVAQDSLQTLHYNGSTGGVVLDYVMSKETGSLSAGTHIINADPLFSDVANGDYHLSDTSPAIDVAPLSTAGAVDLDSLPRDKDLPSVPNLAGPRDLGAYERQALSCGASDTIFCSAFE